MSLRSETAKMLHHFCNHAAWNAVCCLRHIHNENLYGNPQLALARAQRWAAYARMAHEQSLMLLNIGQGI